MLLTIHFCFSSVIAQKDSLRIMKRWQLKGYTESALRLGDFYQAKAFLAEWHRREPKNDAVTMQLGRLSYKVRDYANAENIFTALYEKDPNGNLAALYYLSLVQMHYKNYDGALENFDLLKNRYRRIDEPKVDRVAIERLIEGCHMGIAHTDSVTSVEIRDLSDEINTPYSERGFILINDEEFIYSSVQPKSRRYHQLDAPYKSVRQFYKAAKVDGNWVGEEDVTPPFFIYKEFDTGEGVFSLDGKRFYLTLCSMNPEGENICQIYVSYVEVDGNWSKPEKLGNEVNHPSYTSASPTVGSCFDNTLEVLYFVSDRPGGAGGMDIWFSVYNKRQMSYTEAANAGVFVNTSGDEVTPFFDVRTSRLYFSSNGLAGYGGFDIFYAEGEMVTWQEPVNVGLPINSSFDDLNFVQNYSGEFGLFVSNRIGSKALYHQGCCDDIYTFYDVNSSEALVSKNLVHYDQLDVTLENKSKSDENIEKLNEELEKLRMLNHGAIILADEDLDSKNLSEISIVSTPDEPIVLSNIYYQFDKIELTKEARSSIDSTLLKLMNLFPDILVEVSAHTDSVGGEIYNQQLSEERAQNVVKYLINKGISSDRLTSKGFGSSQPVAPNIHLDGTDNAVGRQKNRRTEFRVIGHSN